jgi:EAL domain-containing protein (putative c-di-GMP-specific phosphodiesterase class I)
VLVVDDELTLVRIYARTLGAEGYRVLTATDGDTAEVMLRRCGLDAVISDVAMPGMDGIKLLRAMRRINGDVPVILATGDHENARAHQAIEEGALMVLVKPVDLRALSQIVAHAIQLRRLATLAREARQRGGKQDRDAEAPAAGLTVCFEAALAKLWMAYQPIVCWDSLGVVGYEALVRSDEPMLTQPSALFGAAGRLGRTLELGRAIRARVAASIPFAPEGTRIFVNLHPEDLADDGLYSTREPLRAHADRVVLEVTERDSLGLVPHLEGRIDTLRAAGFRIAVDDLGAGYSGLASFAQLKPSVVKLDASLIHDIDKSPVKRKIVQAMAALCHDMNVEMVAEGVETEEERQTAGFLGCRYHQGFAYGRPERRLPKDPAAARATTHELPPPHRIKTSREAADAGDERTLQP